MVDANPWIRRIELSNYGEIFLNPDLLRILEYAHARGVSLTADNGVNFNRVSEEVLDGLVRFRFRSMSCSIDGASDATYGIYRVGGDFQTVIENIRSLNRYKKNYGSRYPLLNWQFVVMGHNEHEITAAREFASDLRMRFHLRLTWDEEHFAVRDKERVRREIGYASRHEFRSRHGRDYVQQICHQLWDLPQINWDGQVLGCCRNFWGAFGGNAFQEGLIEAVNSENMRCARDMLLGRSSERPGIPCSSCDIYQHMKATNRWLYRGPLRHMTRAVKRASRLLWW
jgi:MoaA/NifB/PqqE/SkfB family radical SAM enzyme